MNQPQRILIVGKGGAGKDTACSYLAQVTSLRFAGTTSRYLTPYVAERLGISEADAYRTRHLHRNLWHRVGNEVRKRDPGFLLRESLRHAELVGGIRASEEMAVCRREALVDLIVWIANDRRGRDSTLGFSERDCDLVIPNHWTLQEFHARLLRFASFARLPLRSGQGSETR